MQDLTLGYPYVHIRRAEQSKTFRHSRQKPILSVLYQPRYVSDPVSIRWGHGYHKRTPIGSLFPIKTVITTCFSQMSLTSHKYMAVFPERFSASSRLSQRRDLGRVHELPARCCLHLKHSMRHMILDHLAHVHDSSSICCDYSAIVLSNPSVLFQSSDLLHQHRCSCISITTKAFSDALPFLSRRIASKDSLKNYHHVAKPDDNAMVRS